MPHFPNIYIIELQYKNICEEVVRQIFVYNYPGVPISVLFSIITLPNDFRHVRCRLHLKNAPAPIHVFDSLKNVCIYPGAEEKI